VRESVLTSEFHVESMVFVLQQQEGSFPVGKLACAAFVIDPQLGPRLFLDGEVVGASESAISLKLSDIVDKNAWLGKSQWNNDAMLRARFDAFAIYDVALSDPQVQVLADTEPDH
jgi:hypothetical protein